MSSGRVINAWSRVLVFWLVAIWATPSLAQITVKLCDSENPPYSKGKEDGGLATGGLAVSLVEAVFDRIPNAEVEVRMMPWSRCLQAARTGRMDGVLKLLQNAEREQYLGFTEQPIYMMEMVFFYLPEQFPDGVSWETLSDLGQYRIGLSEGSSNGPIIDAAVKAGTLQADYVTADALNVKKLKAGRIDLFPNDKIMGLAAVQHEGLEGEILASEQSVSAESIRIGISKKSEALPLLPEIDRVLKLLWQEGLADRVLMGGK